MCLFTSVLLYGAAPGGGLDVRARSEAGISCGCPDCTTKRRAYPAGHEIRV